MPLSNGDQLGPYEIHSLIGKGGMGEVYRAIDTRLNRPVAIKVSSREFNDRFEREARAISTLNHPNICTLYDVGPNYLILELVEGETLSKIIERGPLPLDKALNYGVQIVDALAAAHAKGVIHRDLKPGNIIITKNGAKVLDFGLAKVGADKISAESATNIQTVTEPITRAGAVLGTLYYMSPEQVEGKDTDERSDIFSFGIVLYEMISGQRPFTGDTQAAVLAALLKDQAPPMSQRQVACPRALERLVRKCLEKKPEDRWQSARDLKPALELIDVDAPTMSSASASVSTPIPVQEPSRTKKWLWPSVGVAALLAIGGLAYTFWPKAQPPPRASRFQVPLPDNVQFDEYVSVSPDGHKLAFVATGSQSGLWIRDLDTLEWRKLTGTEGSRSPFWSPDSKYLGFAVRNELKKIDLAGGPAQTLCAIDGTVGSGAWNKDGVIVFGTIAVAGPLRRVSSAGGVPAQLSVVDTTRGETLHSLPSFLPDGKHFLYFRAGSLEVAGIYAGSLDSKPQEQSKERILATTFAAPYVDGNLFFMREGTLMVQPFDAGKLQLRGEPVPVAEHVATTRSTGTFSVSPAGVLAYRTGVAATRGLAAAALDFQATWLDREGKVTGAVGEPSPDQLLVLSPDGTRAGGRDTPFTGRGDIWVHDLARGVRTRLTFHQSYGSPPVWSPDGTRIAFSAGDQLPDTMYEKAANGTGSEKELLKMAGSAIGPTSWSRDGRFLLYLATSFSGGAAAKGKGRGGAIGDPFDLWVLPLEGDGKPVLLLGTRFGEGYGTFSPDGRWVAYVSDESGRNEVYVRPFVSSGPAGPSLGEGKWQVSKDGATQAPPMWRSDGKELLYGGLNPANALLSVEVNGRGVALEIGTPKQLFIIPPTASFSMSSDGKRFLASIPPGSSPQSAMTPITVVLNWQADLKK